MVAAGHIEDPPGQDRTDGPAHRAGITADDAQDDDLAAAPLATLQQLREPHGSFPQNPLLAEPLYLTKYIERMGTGTRDMIRLCREAGLREPQYAIRDGFVQTLWRPAPEVTLQVAGQPESQPESLAMRVLRLMASKPLAKAEISSGLGQKVISGHLNQLIRLMLADQSIEMTIPEKPRSRLQRYRLTDKGRAWLAARGKEGKK